MTEQTNLLIVGAGPFGLTMAAHAADLGIAHRVVGKPMEFWKHHMPAGMLLRSASDWHLDVAGRDTIERFLAEQGRTPAEVEPLSRDLYLAYGQWFQERKQITPIERYVQTLDYQADGAPGFRATLDDGSTIAARQVVLALGFRYFCHVPAELAALLPAGRFAHSCELVDFAGLRDKRCLIVGGRQGAYEWAALLHEAGAAAVHVTHRHPAPAFAAADWSWVPSLMETMAANPAWFRQLSPAEQDQVRYRLWAEGRLKIEPWLEARVVTAGVQLWPGTQITACRETADGAIAVRLDNGAELLVDQVILATGYQVRLEQVPFLSRGNLLPRLATRNGGPVLDAQFQTSVPGLFITSMPANQDFGPFFAFTVSVRTSARIIGRALLTGGAAA
jgi:cation diffusion facilitator CzcD-associated flavoprotein CzcO